MIKTLFYTFLQTKHDEENGLNHSLLSQEIEIRSITPFPWKILKTITDDELWFGGIFQFPLEQIRDSILVLFPQDVIYRTIQHICNLQLSVKDLDTNTFHWVTLWKYPHENYFAMRESWIEEFVKRRMLVAGMVVGLYWDSSANIFCFSVLEGTE